MKIKIKKQFDYVGEEYLNDSEVEAEIYKSDNGLILEIDGSQYEIPDEALFGVINNSTGVQESER